MRTSVPWSEKEKELCSWLIAMLMLGGLEYLSGKGRMAISTLMTEIHLSAGIYENSHRIHSANSIRNHKNKFFKPEFEFPGASMPTRPDWLPIEFQSLGNDGFTCEDIERCVNFLRDASNADGPSQVEANAKSNLDVEKSPQITESTSPHRADGPTQKSQDTTNQRRKPSKSSPYARTSSNSGVAFDSAPPASAAGIKNPFKGDPSTICLPPLRQFVYQHSSSVASTGLSHTYMSDYSNHAQQPQSTFENKETAAPNIIQEKAEGALGDINSSVSKENPSSRIPSPPPSNSQKVAQD